MDHPCGNADLAPDASTSCTGSHTITQTDRDTGSVSNTATACANDGTTCDSDTTTVSVPQTRRADARSSRACSTATAVDYTFTITNTGNVTLHDFTVDDTLLGWKDHPCGNADLAPERVDELHRLAHDHPNRPRHRARSATPPPPAPTTAPPATATPLPCRSHKPALSHSRRPRRRPPTSRSATRSPTPTRCATPAT